MRHPRAPFLGTNISIKTRVRRLQRRHTRLTTLKTSLRHKAGSSGHNRHSYPIILIPVVDTLPSLPTHMPRPHPPLRITHPPLTIRLRTPMRLNGSRRIMATALPTRATMHSVRRLAMLSLLPQHTLPISHSTHQVFSRGTKILSKAQDSRVEMVATTPHTIPAEASTHSKT